MSHKPTGKGPTYGDFAFPKSDVTYVKGYARGGRVKGYMSGGEVSEYYAKQDAQKYKGPQTQVSANLPKGITKTEQRSNSSSLNGSTLGQAMEKRREEKGILGKLGFKEGGLLDGMKGGMKAQLTNPVPRRMNPQARMEPKFAKGGTVHPDVKEDKALIKRAFGMHDTQLHEGKKTNLTKLKGGGMATKMKKGGVVKNCYAMGGQVEKTAAPMFGKSKMAKKVGGMKTGGVVNKKKGGMCG